MQKPGLDFGLSFGVPCAGRFAAKLTNYERPGVFGWLDAVITSPASWDPSNITLAAASSPWDLWASTIRATTLPFSFTKAHAGLESLHSPLLVAKVGVFCWAFFFLLSDLEESSRTTGDAIRLEAPEA